MIFYSSIGSGHLSAAKSIQAGILQKSPTTQIELKNVRDFMNPTHEKIDERLFWYIVKKHPKKFTELYQASMKSGVTANKISNINQPYNLKKMSEYIKLQSPDAIIATHYGSAIQLEKLREEGGLQNIRIGWLHTDYIDHYFPRLSKGLDQTFLPHEELEKIWIEQGVSKDKIKTTGMPLNPDLLKPVDRETFLLKEGLDPSKRMIVIASGAEGVGDFASIATQISKQVEGDLQIVAVCANNQKNYAALKELKLREGVTVVPHKFIENSRLLNLIKSSDLYITKGGGLSPTEAFAIGKPTVVMDIYGGHETENAKLFEKLNLAVINRDPNKIGEQVNRLLKDEKKQLEILEAQAHFRQSLKANEIIDFALNPHENPKPLALDLGQEAGTSVKLSSEALLKLNQDSPSEIEVLMSHAISPQKKFWGTPDANPFGHIAIRVKDHVYTVNQNAQKGESFLLKIPLKDYLYGTEKPAIKAEIGSHYGVSYSRDTMGLRIGNVTPDKITNMLEEVEKINLEFANGSLKYNDISKNCADVCERILGAGGLEDKSSKLLKVTLPREVFETQLRAVDQNLNLTSELVSYSKVAGSKNYYEFSRYPVSLYDPVDLVRRRLNNSETNKIPPKFLNQFSKRIASYPASEQLSYENIDGKSVKASKLKIENSNTELNQRWNKIKIQETEMMDAYLDMKKQGLDPATTALRSQSAIDRLQPKELEQILKSATGPPAEIATDIKKSRAAFNKFQVQYDQYHRDRLSWMLDYYHANTKAAVELAEKQLPFKKRGMLQKEFTKLDEHYQNYQKYENIYNQPKDVKRIDAFRDFMDQQKVVFKKLDSALQSEPSFFKKVATKFTEFKRKMSFVNKFASTLPEVTNLLYSMKYAKNTAPNKTPVVDHINKAFRKVGDAFGYKVEVFGKENIPTLHDSKTINMFTMQHSHPQLDNIVLSNAGIEPYAIYGAADTFMPKSLANMMDESDHFIVVGRGSDKPIEKTLELLKKEKIKSFVIYPEGSVSVGQYDMRAPRTKFVNGLLGKLKAQGYQVNIIPISLPKNYRLNNDWLNSAPGSEMMNIEAQISKPIDSKLVEMLVGTEDEQFLNETLRSIHFEHLENRSGKSMLGSPPMEELVQLNNAALGAPSCLQEVLKSFISLK